MIDLSKNDVIDVVFNRYVESYKCTLDLDYFMPERDICSFIAYLRKNMLKDFKHVNKEARALRRAKIREYKHMTRKRKQLRKRFTAPLAEEPVEPTETLPQTVSDNSPATAETQTHE